MEKKRTYIEVHVSGTTVNPKLYGALTAGMVGVPVAFSFDESWNDMNRIAVFKGCTTKTRALVEGNDTTVPYEVLQSSGFALEIGVEGRTADGTIVYPSVMKWVGTIQEGADASADPGAEPSPTVYDDIMSAIGNLDSLKTIAKESLVAAINEIFESGGGGEIDPAYIERLVSEYVDEYFEKNPPVVDKSELVLNIPQTLTESQKEQARENIGFSNAVLSLIESNAILHTRLQPLTDDEMRTARQNIGAASVEEVIAALPMWQGGSY